MLLTSLAQQVITEQLPEDRTFRALGRGWHNNIVDFVQYDLPRILVVLLLAFILQRIVLFFVGRMLRLADRQVGKSQRAWPLRALAAILRATAYAVIGFIVLLHILSVFSINLTPLLASAGVLGVGIGLGAPRIFKALVHGIL